MTHYYVLKLCKKSKEFTLRWKKKQWKWYEGWTKKMTLIQTVLWLYLFITWLSPITTATTTTYILSYAKTAGWCCLLFFFCLFLYFNFLRCVHSQYVCIMYIVYFLVNHRAFFCCRTTIFFSLFSFFFKTLFLCCSKTVCLCDSLQFCLLFLFRRRYNFGFFTAALDVVASNSHHIQPRFDSGVFVKRRIRLYFYFQFFFFIRSLSCVYGSVFYFTFTLFQTAKKRFFFFRSIFVLVNAVIVTRYALVFVDFFHHLLLVVSCVLFCLFNENFYSFFFTFFLFLFYRCSNFRGFAARFFPIFLSICCFFMYLITVKESRYEWACMYEAYNDDVDLVLCMFTCGYWSLLKG